MKKIFFLGAFVGSLLTGCNDTFDGIKNLGNNTAPKIFYNDNKELLNLEGQAKRTSKNGSGVGKMYFKLNVNDAEKQTVSLSYEFLKGSGTINLESEEELNGSVPFSSEYIKLIYMINPNKNEEEVNIRFKAMDFFGASTTSLVTIKVFDNLKPIAKFTTKKVPERGNLFLQLDASESTDPDAGSGGGVKFYRWYIKRTGTTKEEIITWEKPVIEYYFPSVGSYEVRLEVIDNDGSGSVFVTETIEL